MAKSAMHLIRLKDKKNQGIAQVIARHLFPADGESVGGYSAPTSLSAGQ
jgi:hypothetical protein